MLASDGHKTISRQSRSFRFAIEAVFLWAYEVEADTIKKHQSTSRLLNKASI